MQKGVTMLYPRTSETREVKTLNGLWKFRIDPGTQGFTEEWYGAPLAASIPMPVPASFNDLTQDGLLREHVGWVWYELEEYVPASWRELHVVLRFDAVAHRAEVYLNGRHVMQNTGGFLPFEIPVSSLLRYGEKNRITVAVSNELDWDILPPGEKSVELQTPGFPPRRLQEYYFDFFNYAGIHRPVRLLAMPPDHLADLNISPGFAAG
ncbi:MAG TPA: beta-glucuronidase, partial [Spirochaetia bacterium]|nr:beta-glucuronidase [Spirochaetia bacterium]